MTTLQSGIDAVVTVAGVPIGGFQTITGGDVTAESVKDRPPGSRFETAVESLPSVSDITVTRSWEEGRDGPLLTFLFSQVGTGPCNIGRLYRDIAQNVVRTDAYAGILVGVVAPEGDSNNTNGKAILSLTFNAWGGPA
jgi:hypothetical protein